MHSFHDCFDFHNFFVFSPRKRSSTKKIIAWLSVLDLLNTFFIFNSQICLTRCRVQKHWNIFLVLLNWIDFCMLRSFGELQTKMCCFLCVLLHVNRWNLVFVFCSWIDGNGKMGRLQNNHFLTTPRLQKSVVLAAGLMQKKSTLLFKIKTENIFYEELVCSVSVIKPSSWTQIDLFVTSISVLGKKNLEKAICSWNYRTKNWAYTKRWFLLFVNWTEQNLYEERSTFAKFSIMHK